MPLQVIGSVADLPAGARALLDGAAREDFQFGAAWFDTLAGAALPPGTAPRFLVWEAGRETVAVLPLQVTAGGAGQGLTSPYTSRFRPLVAPGAAPAQVRRAGAAFGRHCRRFGQVRLDALDPVWPGRADLLAGFRRAGVVGLRFAHFGNWHCPVAGLGWARYLALRPGALRETIRRRLSRAARAGGAEFDLISGQARLAEAIAGYESVYARSWKEPEPYPRFAAELVRAAAQSGALRMGLLRAGGSVIAAQYWLLAGGTATLMKLAYDQDARSLSPGTVLTAQMVRHLLDAEGVRELDFGRGDDEYKAGWTGQRRQREGLLLCSVLHPAGLSVIGRHLAGRLRRALGSR